MAKIEKTGSGIDLSTIDLSRDMSRPVASGPDTGINLEKEGFGAKTSPVAVLREGFQAALERLHRRGGPADMISVLDQLKEIGKPAAELVQSVRELAGNSLVRVRMKAMETLAAISNPEQMGDVRGFAREALGDQYRLVRKFAAGLLAAVGTPADAPALQVAMASTRDRSEAEIYRGAMQRLSGR